MNSERSVMRRSVVAIVAGALLFALIGQAVSRAGPFFGLVTTADTHAAIKLLMIVVSLAAWAALRRPWGGFGIRKATRRRGAWRWYALACGCMMAAATAMILTDSRQPLVAELSFPQVVVSVWLLSSIAEELYVRGLIQSWAAPPGSAEHPKPVVAASALLFSLMHVPLMWKGAGVVGGGIIVVATLGVGWACAELRARSGSLLAPIAAHIAANVAGIPGAIAGTILYRILHGTLPTLNH